MLLVFLNHGGGVPNWGMNHIVLLKLRFFFFKMFIVSSILFLEGLSPSPLRSTEVLRTLLGSMHLSEDE